MNVHRENFWVGGYQCLINHEKVWQLCHPISLEALYQSMETAETVEDYDHRMCLATATNVYDQWYQSIIERG